MMYSCGCHVWRFAQKDDISVEAERKAEALLVVFVEFVFLAPLDLH